MNFKVGDTVVYPHHGAARVEDIVTRTIKGEQIEYLVLKVADGDMTVQIPSTKLEYAVSPVRALPQENIIATTTSTTSVGDSST